MSVLKPPHPENSSNETTDGPFFTVLIPTMNRPQLLNTAVESVMWQTFKDFELIVSDNSNDEKSMMQNRKTVAKFADDPRVHYINPPQWMNMPDHWEFASRHASGRYVVILTDKHVMRPSALQFLYLQSNYSHEESKVISWHHASAFSRSGIVTTPPFTSRREVIDSKQEILEFARCSNWRSNTIFINRLPRMLNSCYRFDVARAIRANHGRLFMPLSPDYTCAFLLLSYTNKFTYLDWPLFMNHGNQSNGRNSLLNGTKEYISSLGGEDIFFGTPVPFNTLTNSVIRDLMMVKNLVGARLSDVSIDLVGYFMCNYRELLIMQMLGTQVNVRALYAQWWESIQILTPEQQKTIKEYVNELEQKLASLKGLRRLAVRLGLDPIYHSVLSPIRRIRHRLAGKPVYANVLDAAMQTDYLLRDADES
jgi:hypothetical protein